MQKIKIEKSNTLNSSKFLIMKKHFPWKFLCGLSKFSFETYLGMSGNDISQR